MRSNRSWPPATDTRSSVHVIEGPAGIGKSYRFGQLLREAAAGSVRIMRAQPSQAETRLVGSALIDLCAEVSDGEIAVLPDVQANALATALLRGSAPIGNPNAVSVAFSGLLTHLTADVPLVIAIDDVQWLDQQTAEALTFAARRLRATGACILLTRRTEPQTDPPQVVTDLCTALPSEREQLDGLPRTTIEQLLQDQLGSGLRRADVAAAIDLAAGNPLFAVELARSAAADRDRGTQSASTSLPKSLYDAVGRHVAALDRPARDAIAAAAALGKPQLRQLRALGADLDLAEAEAAGLVHVANGAIVFSHPLYAAAAYDQLGAGERARLHQRLAEVADGREEQARHLALGASEPDEAVAEALDLASNRALARGAPNAALDAANLALAATPGESVHRSRRLGQVGELLFRTGSTDQAMARWRSAVDGATTDRDRAVALRSFARATASTGAIYDGYELGQQALSLVGDDDLDLKADIFVHLAVCCPDDYDAGLQYAIQARTLLEQLPDTDPSRLADAVAIETGARFYAGVGCDLTALRDVVDLQAGDTTFRVADRAISVLAYVLFWFDDYPPAREAFAEAMQMAIDEGDDHSMVYFQRHLASLEIRAGRWTEAEQLIDEYEELAERFDLPVYSRRATVDRARIRMHRGETAAALPVADEDIEGGIASEQLLREQLGRGMRGFCALVDGDPARAARDLDRYLDIFVINNAAEPALREYAGDHIESLVLAGRDLDAEKAIDSLVELSEPLDRTVMLAAAARGKALLLAERGDVEQALLSAEEALALYRTIERPYEAARAHLVKGQLHRRLRQKALAKHELAAALAIFTELGAAGFADRTRQEIDRIGGRAAAPLELTETERLVAEAAASGRTTAEIATALFISTHTVSANLTRVFRKLGVRNRTELAARLEGTPSAEPNERGLKHAE